MSDLEGCEEELSWAELQEADALLCHRGLQKNHQIFAHAEAGTDGCQGRQACYQHALAQLLQMVPDGDAEVPLQL